jgi:hypothetical protein
MSHGNVHRQLVAHFAITNDSMDFDGNEVILDADGDTSITSDTDDQIDVRISGADDFQFTANTFKVLSGSDVELGSACSITGEGTTLFTWDATGVSAYMDNAQLQMRDGTAIEFGTGATSIGDASIGWRTGDASNHTLVIGLDNTSQSLHITDFAAVSTDWNVSANTHPTIYIHSNTTPATDYMTIGGHTGTNCTIDAVGTSVMSLDVDGASGRVNVVDGKALVVGADGVPATYGGGNFIGLEDSGTDPSSTYTNSLALYTPDGGDSLDFLHADGTTDSLGT